MHGVLNTDNINVTGESFDYGPYRFLPVYDPGFTAAYFDQTGLYAFGRQADTIAWNCARLAETLLLVAPVEPLQEMLERYPDFFWRRCARPSRIALGSRLSGCGSRCLLEGAVPVPEGERHSVRGGNVRLYGGPARLQKAFAGERANFYAHASFEPVKAMLEARKPGARANLAHPYFARANPFTLLYPEIESLWHRLPSGMTGPPSMRSSRRST